MFCGIDGEVQANNVIFQILKNRSEYICYAKIKQGHFIGRGSQL